MKLLAGIFLTGFFFYGMNTRTQKSVLSYQENEISNDLHFVKWEESVTMNFPFPNDYKIQDTGIREGRNLMHASDCYSCHGDYKVLLAPSYKEIADKYKNDKDAVSKLVKKVIEGSKGVWGDQSMPAHPEFLREDAQKMIQYILHLSKQNENGQTPARRI